MIVKSCNICGRIYPSDLAIRFCLHCGGLLAPDHLQLYSTCPICGTITLPEAHFCHYCGTAVAAKIQPASPNLSQKEEVIPITPEPDEKVAANPIVEFSHELDLILSDTVANEPVADGYNIEEESNSCAICGHPLPPGTKDCPNCQSINVNLGNETISPPESELTEKPALTWSDSFSELFSGDAFREIFTSGGLNMEETSTNSIIQPTAKSPVKREKPTIFIDDSTSDLGLPSSSPQPGVEEMAEALAAPKTDVTSFDLEKPKSRLRFGLPPIPWWGWVGGGFILLLIIVYFLLIPLLSYHEPEPLQKPQAQAETTPAVPQATNETVSQVPELPQETLLILLPKVSLLESPDSNALHVGDDLTYKTKVYLIEERENFISVKTDDGRSGWIEHSVQGKLSTIAEKDFSNRKITSPVIYNPHSGQTINTFPRTVTVHWGKVNDPESVSYTLVAQYGNGKGSWWDVARRSLSGTSTKLEFPGAYPARVMVTATTADGISSSSDWVNFKFAQ